MPKYSTHPYYKYFMWMIQRAKKHNLDCAFTWGLSEFTQWLEIIGPIPKEIVKPSVGRHDHSKGYIFDEENNRWNFRWQEWNENNNEAQPRRLAAQFASGKHPTQTGAALAGSRAARHSPNLPHHTKVTCPHCSKIGGLNVMKRYHFKNCKLNPASKVST